MGIELDEGAVPVTNEVNAACELLGLDPLQIANEGKLVAICPPERVDELLAAMRSHPLGRKSAHIGEVEADERPLEVALREFAEETGQSLERCAPDARPQPLGTVRQRGGKLVAAWAVEGEWPVGAVLSSNSFELEWTAFSLEIQRWWRSARPAIRPGPRPRPRGPDRP